MLNLKTKIPEQNIWDTMERQKSKNRNREKRRKPSQRHRKYFQ